MGIETVVFCAKLPSEMMESEIEPRPGNAKFEHASWDANSTTCKTDNGRLFMIQTTISEYGQGNNKTDELPIPRNTINTRAYIESKF